MILWKIDDLRRVGVEGVQAARGYVIYDGDGRFFLPDEHAVPLTDETSPACVIGAFEIALGSVYATDTIAECFRSGAGFAWGAHDGHVLQGCERSSGWDM